MTGKVNLRAKDSESQLARIAEPTHARRPRMGRTLCMSSVLRSQWR